MDTSAYGNKIINPTVVMKQRVREMREAVRSIRFPAELWKQLKKTAQKNHRTAAQQALLYVEEGLNEENRPQ